MKKAVSILFFFLAFSVNAQIQIYPFFVSEFSDHSISAIELGDNKLLSFIKVYNTGSMPTKQYFIKFDEFLKPLDTVAIDNSNGNEIFLTEVIHIDDNNIWFIGYGSNENLASTFISLFVIDKDLNIKTQNKIELDDSLIHEKLVCFLNKNNNIVIFEENNHSKNFNFYELDLNGNILNTQKHFNNIKLQSAWQHTDSTYILLQKFSYSEVFIDMDTSYWLQSVSYQINDTSYAKLTVSNFNRTDIRLSLNKHLVGGQVLKNSPLFDDSTYISDDFIEMYEIDGNMNFRSLFSYNKRESNSSNFPLDELVSKVPNYLYLTGMQDVNHSYTDGQSSIIEVFQLDTLGNMNWHNSIQVDDAHITKNTCVATKDTGYVVFVQYVKYGNSDRDIYAIKFDKNGNQIKLSDNTVLGINPIITLNKIGIFPNPSNGVFTINAEISNVERLILIVRNIEGKEIVRRSFKVLNGLLCKSLDLSKYDSGIYFVEIATENNRYIQKILLE